MSPLSGKGTLLCIRAYYSVKKFLRLPAHRTSIEHKTRKGRTHVKGAEHSAGQDQHDPNGISFCGLLNAVICAAGFALCRKIGGFSVVLRHTVGCRGPPLLKFGFPKFQKNGGTPNGAL